jgi:signal transduction histidine kinase
VDDDSGTRWPGPERDRPGNGRAVLVAPERARAATTSGPRAESDPAAAVREERDRIGRELHDGVIQSLYVLGLGLEATIQALESDVPLARARLIRSRDTIDNVIQEVREYVVGLRAERGSDLSLASRFAEVAVTLSLDLIADVSPEVERALSPAQRLQLYLIGREALVNVARHARATRISVTLRRARGTWALRIRDDGAGFGAGQVLSTSFGLRTMRERARLLGAEFTITSRPGQGTEVRVRG